MKNIKLTLTILIFLIAFSASAQNVGINSTGSNPDGSAMLDVSATDKGVLIPRVDLDDASTAAPITSPVTGLLIYNQGGNEPDGFYFWNGSAWTALSSSSMDGSGATNHVAYWSDADNLTYDNNVFYWDATNNRLGIGNNIPAQALDVTGNIRMSGTRTKIFYKGDGPATHEGSVGLYTPNSGTSLIIDPCDNTGNSVASSSVNFGGFGNFVSNEVSVNISNQLGVNTNNPGNNQLLSVYNGTSFTAGDGSLGVGVFGSTTQSETIYGVVGEAILTSWSDNDLMTGVYGKLTYNNEVYAEGYLSYNDIENDFTGVNALVGVAGVVTDKQDNNNKHTIAGFFRNDNNGSGARNSINFGVGAISSEADATSTAKNCGLYSLASGASTNWSIWATTLSASTPKQIEGTHGIYCEGDFWVNKFTYADADYSLTLNDFYVYVNTNVTLTVPTATGCEGKIYYIKSTHSGNTTVTSSSNIYFENNAPATSITLGAYGFMGVISNGTNWLTFK